MNQETQQMTTSSAGSPGADVQPRRDRRWWLLVVVGLAQLTIILDTTIINIALPSAQTALHFSNSDRQWVLTAYALAFGGLLLIGGRLVDRFGRKWSLIIGLAGFALASAVGGAAVDFPMLAIARGAQGAFGALMAPAALAVLTTTFPEGDDRARAFGVFAAISAAGAPAGLLLGGVLTEYASWRWTLYVNLVLAAAAVIGALLLIPRARTSTKGTGADPVGTFSITLGLFALVFGFSSAESSSWSSAVTIVSFVIGAALLTLFGLTEARVRSPLFPLRILADRTRATTLFILLLASVGLYAEFLFLTYYLQRNLGFSPLIAGVAFLPQTAGTIAVATLGSGLIMRRLPPGVVLPGSMIGAAGGMFWLSQISTQADYLSTVLPAVILLGASLGAAFTAAFSLAVVGVDPDDAGVASAAVNAMQQIGGSVGPSLFNTIAASIVASFAAAHATMPQAQLTASADVHSYSVAFAIAAAILLGGALVSGLVLNLRPSPDAPA